MESASPFHNLTPHKYVKLRYAPLVATIVEPDVENLFNLCGISFNDLFAVLGSTQTQPIRIVPHYTVVEESQESFFGQVFNDLTLFSQSFIFPEYESEDSTVPQLSPIPARFPSKFHYPSPEASKPPWYSLMLEKLLQSIQYTKLDFADLPCCIVYASMSASAIPTKKVDEIRKLVQFPQWMNDFIHEIPIVQIVVTDGLVSKTPKIDKIKTEFAKTIPLVFRTRLADSETDIEDFFLRNLFKYDEKLLSAPNFCKFLTKNDFENVRQTITGIYNVCSGYLDGNIRFIEHEFKQAKSFFNKKKLPDHLVQGVPWNKLAKLKLAAYYLNSQKYELARKYYKSFAKDSSNLPELKLNAMFMASICVVNSSNQHQFKELTNDILANIHQAKSIRFLLMVPLISCEFHASVNERDDAFNILRSAVSKITKFWNGNVPMKSLFVAMIYERWAGTCSNKKKSLLMTSRAAYLYKLSNQIPHALRCYIWLFRSLPRDSWQLLYQTVWLQKATILADLTQFNRSLSDCKDLLALTDLAPSLQDRVAKQFWVPFNDTANKAELNTRINSLLEVKSLKILDVTSPVYWGLEEREFAEINERFEHFIQRRMVRSISFDSWYEDEEFQSRKKKKAHKVGVKTEIILTIRVYNRYKFPIILNRCVLKADYHCLETSKDQISNSSPSALAHSSLSPPPSSLAPPNETQQQQDEEDDEVFESQNAILEQQHVVLAKEIGAQPVAEDKSISPEEIVKTPSPLEHPPSPLEHPPSPLSDSLSPLDPEINEAHEEVDLFAPTHSEAFYKIVEINDKNIPGKEATDVRFKFVPLSEGIYTVSRFIKNYWGKVDTEVACGPLTLVAKDSYPQLTMEIIDFPTKCYSGQCVPFSLKLKNTGTATIKEIIIVFDQNDCVVCLEGPPPAKFPTVSIYNMKKRFEPNEEINVKMILWATAAKRNKDKTKDFHFCAAANGLRCAFDKKTVTIIGSVVFDSVIFRKKNDTENMTFQTTIKSLVDGLTVVGFIDREGRYLKTIKDATEPTLKKGETMSIIGYTSDPTDETVESWRSELGGHSPLSILYRIKDDQIISQASLKLELKEPRVRLSLKTENLIKVGSKNVVTYTLIKSANYHQPRTIYIKPLPIRFLDHHSKQEEKEKKNATKTNRVCPLKPSSSTSSSTVNRSSRRSTSNSLLTRSSSTASDRFSSQSDLTAYQPPIVQGCRWIGKTVREVNESTHFEAQFTFASMQCGVYEIPGVIFSFTPDFKKPMIVNVQATFRVVNEEA
ncbi:hypothetical protein TRFO_23108 [Tritrichomonas foetus]|uniref:Uncharacterized protein n=1 Tax=Tritrichomonas foetus TaxID=1144522 RepID=A0A1J4KFM2_9EUKA|nr:hypothetical protein TRFO_23108 [Tritrichomonas foetus]|eukprot:OHT08422.1 hypothetical protein TRFO_23108 [Tritrichomonas foetus]